MYPFFLFFMVVFLVVTSTVTLVTISKLWPSRHLPATRYAILMLAASVWWGLSATLEYLARDISIKIWAAKLQIIGAQSLVLFFVLFTLTYVNRGRWITRLLKIVLWGMAIITIGLTLTNESHHLIWTEIVPIAGSPFWEYQHGDWFWVSVIYGYTLTLFCVGLILCYTLRQNTYTRWQSLLIVVAVLIPLLTYLTHITNIFPIPGVDPTPLSFMVSMLLVLSGLYFYPIFDIRPIARTRLFATLPDALVVIDTQFRVVDMNPAACRIFKVSLKDATGQPAIRVVKEFPALVQALQEANSSLNSDTLPAAVQDAQNRYYELRPNHIYDSHNEIVGWVLSLRDITEQRQLEMRANHLAAVVEQAQEAVVITDDNGIITYANPFFETITGYAVREAMGKNPRILKSGKQDQDFYKKLWDTISSGDSWSGTFINKRKDGSLYYEHATIFPIKNPDNQITGYAAVKRDITEQIQSEERQRLFAERLSALHDINLELSLLGSIDEICKQAVIYGQQELGFDRIGLWFVDPNRINILHGSYGIDENGELRDERDQWFDTSDSPEYHHLLKGVRRVHYIPYRSLQDHHENPVGWGSHALAPLWDGRQVIGYMMIDNLISQQPITIYQRELLYIFAQVVGNLVSRHRAAEQLQGYVRRQSLLNEIIHAAIKETGITQMLQTLVDRMTELLHANSCYITSWDEEQKLVIAEAASDPLREEYRKIPPNPFEDPTYTKKVLEVGEPLLVNDIYQNPYIDTSAVDPKKLEQISHEPGLALPLIAHGQKLGAVLLAFPPNRKLTPEEIRLGMQAADQIALAMLKVRLLEQADRRAREAETLRLAGAAVVASLNQDETIERILEAMNQVVPYDSGAVLLPKNQATEIIIMGARGFQYDIVGQGFPLDENTPSKIVFETCQPHIIDDVQTQYEDFRHPPYDHIHGWMGIPLTIQDHIIGMLTLDSKEPGRFTQKHARLAQAFADQVAIALENARLFEETRRLAITDSLTQIYNRGHFMKLAQREFKRAARYNKPLSLIMLDIDYFKQVNDTYGHIVGDKTLQEIVRRCLDNLRSVDLIGRYGGEEFVILLPETALSTKIITKDNQHPITIQPARTVAERLRRTFSQETLKIGQHTFTLTVSLGVTEYHPDDKNIEDIINRADQALLKAKSQGRNRIIVYTTEESDA